jgi:hypothetical protein
VGCETSEWTLGPEVPVLENFLGRILTPFAICVAGWFKARIAASIDSTARVGRSMAIEQVLTMAIDIAGALSAAQRRGIIVAT